MISEQDVNRLRDELKAYAIKLLDESDKDYWIMDVNNLVQIGIYQYMNHISNGYGHEYAMTWAKRWMKGDLNDNNE